MVRARSTASRLKTFMVYVFLTALVGFVLLPFVQMLLLSFTSTLPRDGIAQWQFSTINFQNIIASPLLSGSIVNSIIYVSLNVIVTLLVAIPAAYAIARYRFTGDKHVFLLLIAFRITPPVVLTLPVFILFCQGRAGETLRWASRWCIVSSTSRLPYGFSKASFRRYPESLMKRHFSTAIPCRGSSSGNCCL
jgi:ABC-type glycerol-3-phosphate transport system permease component